MGSQTQEQEGSLRAVEMARGWMQEGERREDLLEGLEATLWEEQHWEQMEEE